MDQKHLPPIGAPRAPGAALAAAQPPRAAPRIPMPPPSEVPGIPQALIDRSRQVSNEFLRGAIGQRQPDPLSQPFKLPSNGLYYQRQCPGHTGEILIAPMRGEQEEIIASAADIPGADEAALRHVTSQCFDLKGVPFPEMLLLDWNAALLQFLSQSVGESAIQLGQLTHPGCNQSDIYAADLADLASTVMRVAEPGEATTWPPKPLDHDAAALRAMEGRAGVETWVVSPEDATEPFNVVLKGNTQVAWRYARIRDLAAAEEYAQSVGSASKLNAYLFAAHIVAIDGKPVSPLEALAWIKATPSFVLMGLRAAINARTFGYEMEVRLTCKRCGGHWKVALPENGRLFRPPGL